MKKLAKRYAESSKLVEKNKEYDIKEQRTWMPQKNSESGHPRFSKGHMCQYKIRRLRAC